MREVGWDKWWAFYGYVMMSVNGSIAAGDDESCDCGAGAGGRTKFFLGVKNLFAWKNVCEKKGENQK